MKNLSFNEVLDFLNNLAELLLLQDFNSSISFTKDDLKITFSSYPIDIIFHQNKDETYNIYSAETDSVSGKTETWFANDLVNATVVNSIAIVSANKWVDQTN